MSVAIKIENVSKLYRLGTVGTGTMAHDLNRWWHQIRGKEDPYAKVGQVNDRTQSSTSSTRHQALGTKNGAAPDYVWALRDINLEVQQGEILGIIGRNGAGKSTLLKLLSRVTAPTTGSIKTKGRIASLLEVGTGFHPELTGRENIYMNGAILGMRRHEITRQLDDIVDFSGCAKYLDTPVKRYSSGMTVRLGFAVAAHLNCEVLVVDEVLAVGDAEFQSKCIGKMKEVSIGFGKTILFISHNLTAIEQLTRRAIIMQTGTVIYDGKTSDTISRYTLQFRPNIKREDVRYLPRLGNNLTREIEFIGLRMVAELDTFSFGSPIVFEVKLLCHRNGSANAFALTIYDSRETPVGSFVSKHFSTTGSSQEVTYLVRLENSGLGPGHYSCAVSVNDYSRNPSMQVDALADVLHFEVVGDPPAAPGWNPACGAVFWDNVTLMRQPLSGVHGPN